MATKKTDAEAGVGCVKGRGRKRPEGLKRYQKTHFEPKAWNFEETNALMNIWSEIDLQSFDSKQSSYRHISDLMKTLGFDRNQEQIRTKIQRIYRHKGNDLLNHSFISDESVDHQSVGDVLAADNTDDTSRDSTSDLYDFIVSDIESEDSLFGCFSSLNKDLKQSEELEEKEENEKFFEKFNDLKNVTIDCFQQIMSGQQQLQESIESFNQELNRLSDILSNNNSNNLELMQNSTQESKPKTVQKLVIPNINKKFIMDLTDD